MTSHELRKKMEFDVFSYTSDKSLVSDGKVYVKMDKLFTRDMLVALMKHNLPKGTSYNIEYFVFPNVDVCMNSVYEMYRTLQKMQKYNEYCTLCLSMLEDTFEQE